jgi:16S rRNA (guanine966-N2)-methyltransferase
MKIIGGTAKGRNILFPAKSSVRPTTDRIKGSLFNILSSVSDKRFLDVFAGSGSIGMEALSRGAAFATFIEINIMLCKYIKENLLKCGFDGRFEIFTMGVNNAIHTLQNKNERFDIIFADPPYQNGLVEETIGYLANGELFAKGGFLIIQHSVREGFSRAAGSGIDIFDERRYGDSMLSFMKFR